MKNSILIILISVFLFGCGSLGGNKKPDPLLLENTEVIAGENRVLLGDFRIKFITFDKSSAKSESPMFSSDSGYAKSTLRAKLVGVSESVMQEITDTAYQDFISQLKNAGYSIENEKTLTSNSLWKDIDTEKGPIKVDSSFKAWTGGTEESTTLSPSGKSLLEFSMGNTMPYNVYAAADEIGMPIVNVNYTVHFVYFGSETDYKANAHTDIKGAEYSAEVSLGQGIQVVPGSNVEFSRGLTSTFSHPNATISIGAPVVVPGAYGSNEDATSGAQKAANVFSSIVGIFSGSSQSATEINITADPAIYAANAKKALIGANKRIADALAVAK